MKTDKHTPAEEYETFGPEWKKEVNKLPKALLIDFWSETGRQAETLLQANRELLEALENLIFTASKLWDDAKLIKDTQSMTVTHPIIEEAKSLIEKYKDL